MKPPTESNSPVMDRLGRSLPGATRDVVLIVVSILIAFALEAWWDGWQRAEDEREALLTLAEELRGSRIELDSVIAHNEGQVQVGRYFLDLAERGVPDLPRDSLFIAFNGLSGGMTFDPSIGATEAILAAGLPRDPGLRAQIGAWPGILREIEADQDFILQRYEKMSDALVATGHSSTLARLGQLSAALTPGDQEGRARLNAEFDVLMDELLADPLIIERTAAMGQSIGDLLYELEDVDERLSALEAAVAARLENR